VLVLVVVNQLVGGLSAATSGATASPVAAAGSDRS
jgi:hypothetical protein